MFLVAGIQLPFWPVWLAARGLSAREIGIVLAAAIWVKVVATPTIGVIADRLGARRAVMGVLAATALVSYVSLWSVGDFGVLVSLTLVALTAQSALMPLGDTVTFAISRLDGLDYGRIRFWGSVSFILASLVSGAVLWSASGEQVLPLVLGTSALVLLACLGVPSRLQARNPFMLRCPRAFAAALSCWERASFTRAVRDGPISLWPFSPDLGYSEPSVSACRYPLDRNRTRSAFSATRR
jgi:PPP family 3-phenylpropionic acid transporter